MDPPPHWAEVDSFRGNRASPELSMHRRCPLCGADRAETVVDLGVFQFYTDSADLPKRAPVRQVRCLSCGALYMNPCYSDYGFEVLFAESEQSYGAPDWKYEKRVDWLRGVTGGGRVPFGPSTGAFPPPLEDAVTRKRRREEPPCETSDPPVAGCTVVDIGCHHGQMLSRLPAGVRKVGIDMNAESIAAAREKHGDITFIVSDLDPVDYDGPMDVVVLCHVLEHLPDPVGVLARLGERASAHTRLAVEVPVLELGRTEDINGFFSVHHLTHFTRRSLGLCLAAAGWEIVESETEPDYNGFRVTAAVTAVTAPGAAAPRGEAEDAALLQDHLAHERRNIDRVRAVLARAPEADRCVLWGGGCHTEVLYHVTDFLTRAPGRTYMIVDSDQAKWGRTWRGLFIHDPGVLCEVDWGRTVLLVSSYGGQPAIVKQAVELGVPPERMITLYEAVR